MPSITTVLKLVSALGSGLFALKLLNSGLFRRYRYFFAYLIFRFCYVSIGMFLDAESDVYFWFFICAQPFVWAFYVLVVRELFGLVLARHKGFYTLGRWAMYLVTAVSVVLSGLALLPQITPEMPQASVPLVWVVAVERGVDFSLSIFVLLMMAVLAVYAVPLARNVIVHAVIFTVFFLSSEMGMMMRTIFGLKYADEVDTGLMAATAACIVTWVVLITAKGEKTSVRLPWFRPEQEERILFQLDSLNASLMKVARK